jgi:hypothetical protein
MAATKVQGVLSLGRSPHGDRGLKHDSDVVFEPDHRRSRVGSVD